MAGARAFDVKSSGSYETLDQVAATVVRSSGGQLIRVGDVSEVRWGYADSTYQARYNGKRAVFVSVTEQGNQSVGAVRDRLWAELDRFERELPPNITLARRVHPAGDGAPPAGRAGGRGGGAAWPRGGSGGGGPPPKPPPGPRFPPGGGASPAGGGTPRARVMF